MSAVYRNIESAETRTSPSVYEALFISLSLQNVGSGPLVTCVLTEQANSYRVSISNIRQTIISIGNLKFLSIQVYLGIIK